MLRLQTVSSEKWKGDLWIRYLPAPEEPSAFQPGEKVGEVLLRELARPSTPGATHVAIVSLGPAKKISAEIVRRAGAATARWLAERKLDSAGVDLASIDQIGLETAVPALCEGLFLGDFQFDRHKSDPKPKPDLRLSLVSDTASREVSAEIRRARIVAEAVNLARQWAHEPPNLINPVSLAERVQPLAEEAGLACKIFDHKALAKMGAGAIVAVGQGSRSPSRMIVLEWPGSTKGKQARPVVLVGKAITFDTGGYSLKTREGIVGMKFDKSGGMTVIGALQAAAALKLRTRVIGIVAAAENAISEQAYRPNDIITAMNGKTIEIISTDAEGRLVLADALTYAQRTYKPRALVDLATLTGGVVVSLGSVRAGLMSNDDDLAQALFEAGERTHERLWRLPLDEDYFEQIKGDDSDVKNSGGPKAQPVIGGLFLKQFVEEEFPWAHIDIAGTATSDGPTVYGPKGATGFGVRLLIEYLSALER